MENNPLISVIVPVYQVKDYLAECLEPLAHQVGVYSYEVILVDDGSTDGSEKICDAYATQYPAIFKAMHQENRGLSLARNAGISLARGLWLAFADADDIPHRDFVLGLVHCVMAHHECDAASVGFSTMGKNDKLKTPAGRSGVSSGLFAAGLVLSDSVRAYVWNKCVSHAFLNKTGLRFYPFRSGFEDLPFSFAVFLSAKAVAFTKKSCYTYRAFREGSVSQTSGTERLYSHINSLFACRAYADRILGPQAGAAMFASRINRFRLLLIPDLPSARKKPGEDKGVAAKAWEAFKVLRLLGEDNLQVYGAPWEREVLAYSGSLPGFVSYNPSGNGEDGQ